MTTPTIVAIYTLGYKRDISLKNMNHFCSE